MKLKDLKKNPRNPRKISSEKLDALKKSLEKYGDLSGVVYNRRSGQLISGHQRHSAGFLESEIEIVKTFFAPNKQGTVAIGWVHIDGENHKYREVDVDPILEMEMNLAANKHGGEWDFSILPEWLNELDSHNVEMDIVGWSEDELAKIMAPFVEEAEFLADEDTNVELPKEAKTKPGDLYRLGRHVLLCGDATNVSDVERLMGGGLADMVWTDPPYNVNYVGSTDEELTIKNDNLSSELFYQLLYDAYSNMLMFTKAGGAIYVAYAGLEGVNFKKAMVDSGWLLKQCLVWIKQSLVMGRQDYHWKHEPILYGWKPGASHSWFSDRKQSTVLEFDKTLKNAEHPTMKPVELVAYMIGNSCPPKGSVLDLFGGSGTTLIAAEKIGRMALLCELDPKYCDVIVARYEKLTGAKAELVV